MEEEMEELHVEGVAAHDDPEACVDDPQGRGEALTGACAGRAIEPRNQGVRGADVVTRTEGTIAGGASASRQGTPRGQRTRACTEPPCARTGRSHDCPPTRRGAGRSGKAMPYARDERLWEVGQPHSTCEAAEQGRESGCGGGGGKGAGRGEHGQQDAPRTQGRNWCVTCAGSCAPGRAWPNPTLDPSQEPSAVVPHAGICAGGRPKGRSLPRPCPRRRIRRTSAVRAWLGAVRAWASDLTACAAAAAGGLEPVQSPLGHQRVLELRDRPEDLGEHPAEGGGGVHALVEYHDGSSRRAGGQVGGG